MWMIVLSGLLSCTKSTTGSEGSVSFVISSDQYLADITKSNVSDYTTLPGSDDFVLTINNSAGNAVWRGKIGRASCRERV